MRTSVLLALLFLPASALAGATAGKQCEGAALDYNGTASIRGYFDYDQTSGNGCQPRISIDRMCLGQFVWQGGDVAPLGTRFSPTVAACWPTETVDAHAHFRQKLDAACAALGIDTPPIIFAYRFDLIQPQEMAKAVEAGTFPYQCLIPAEDDLDRVITELATNTPAFTWSDAYGGGSYAASPTNCFDHTGAAIKCELRDFVNAACVKAGGSSCSTAYKRFVYYTTRIQGGSTVYSAIAFINNLTIPACRTWAIDNFETKWASGAWDIVLLNHKLGQMFWTSGWSTPPVAAFSRWKSLGGANWLAPAAPDIPWSSVPQGAAGDFDDLTAPWSATSTQGAYPYSEYTQGEAAVATELAARGIPYEWETGDVIATRTGSSAYDNPATAGLNEQTGPLAAIEDGAKLVVLQRNTGISQADHDTIMTRLGRRGHVVTDYDQPNPPEASCLSASISSAPTPWLEIRVLRQQDDALQIGELGTLTGAWTGRGWCGVPSWEHGAPAPSGPPTFTMAQSDGVVSIMNHCAAMIDAGPVTRVVIEITQGGETVLGSADFYPEP